MSKRGRPALKNAVRNLPKLSLNLPRNLIRLVNIEAAKLDVTKSKMLTIIIEAYFEEKKE